MLRRTAHPCWGFIFLNVENLKSSSLIPFSGSHEVVLETYTVSSLSRKGLMPT